MLANNKAEQSKNYRALQTGKEISASETTIYQPAVPRITIEEREQMINSNEIRKNRNSSSSEDVIDTSDELVLTSDEFMEIDENNENNENTIMSKIIS